MCHSRGVVCLAQPVEPKLGVTQGNGARFADCTAGLGVPSTREARALVSLSVWSARHAAYDSDTNFAATEGFGNEHIFLSRVRLTSHPQSPVLRQLATPTGGMFEDAGDWRARPRAEASASEGRALESTAGAGRRRSAHSGKSSKAPRRSESHSRPSGVMVSLRSSPIAVQQQRLESVGADWAPGRLSRARPSISVASANLLRPAALPAVSRPRATGDARQRSAAGLAATSSSGRLLARATISRLQLPPDDPRDPPPRRLDPLPGRGHRSAVGGEGHSFCPEDLSLKAFIKKHDHVATLDAVVDRFSLQGRVISQGLTAQNSLLYLPPTPDAGKIVLYLGSS